jgi:hypothetical protein
MAPIRTPAEQIARLEADLANPNTTPALRPRLERTLARLRKQVAS